MQIFRPVLYLAILCAGLSASAQGPESIQQNGNEPQPLAIIPKPVSIQAQSGSFTLDKNVVLVADSSDFPSANFFNDYLQEIYGFRLRIVREDQTPASAFIRLYNHPDRDPGIVPGPEGRYTLKSGASSVVIRGDTHVGVFYGIQSLIQLLPLKPYVMLATGPAVRAGGQAAYKIPAVSIEDYPRFGYRGLMLDVCRHFYPVEFVKRYIDFIALHKMNYFHWHLTDDQGWRVEIKKYPRLTEVGAWRSGTIIGHYPGTGNDSTPHGGFYTQEQIKEVVKYAADRYITVLPEIELPGHASAALASYPWLGCTGGPYHVQQTWGVFNDVYCAGNDSVFLFLEEVLDEVMPLFPGKYIHIGGDECPKDSWKTCPKCQRRIKENGLKDENGLQSYFVQRIEKYINSKGKQIIGWDEILEGGLAPNASVMSWRGEQGGIDAARQNHDVVMTPGEYVYFDHSQLQNDDSLTIGGYLPVNKVYQYEPVPKGLTAEEARHIKGAQANLWTEYITNPGKIGYMIFPRLSALSEVLWSPKEQRNWPDFERRLQTQYIRYQLWHVNYYRAYMPPADTLVRQKLAQWQDSKFGLLMHWGTYSQWGIVESWSICPEDEGWTVRRGPHSADYFDYLTAYKNLQTTFNPTRFDPDRWAAAAKAAGMKYVVFTTKHHDGFCMFDTKQTDYKITSSKTPFSTNPKANVAKEIFNAFRKDDFMIGAYFSKPDWNCDQYWWPYFPPKDRNVNYDPAKHPDRWQGFKDYTYKQIQELMTGYGRMDLLWLDGGWVRPLNTIDPGVDWQRSITYDQDVDMARIAKMARSNQPGLLVVDRSVPGEFENYTTPEQQVPSHPMEDPWESCITMGNSWSYVPHDHYKSAGQLIGLLVKIVSRGGNLLLNVGPSPDGEWDDTAYSRLQEIGAWMKINSEGIYSSKPCRPYSAGDNIYLTQSKDESTVYGFYLGDQVKLPAEVSIDGLKPAHISHINLLGYKDKLKWRQDGRKLTILIPGALQNKVVGQHAVTLRISK
jgi:N-acetyl-beta-hexosaminidase/alpha-L-fucosidase